MALYANFLQRCLETPRGLEVIPHPQAQPVPVVQSASMDLPSTVVDLPSLRRSNKLDDVTFVLHEEGCDESYELYANKTILSCASEVFKTQFFGSIPAEKVVHVKDSNGTSFSTFLDMLYNIKIDLNKMNLKRLGELFYLVQKYQVSNWREAIIKNVKQRKLKVDEVLDAVVVAEANSHLTEFAKAINIICAKFVHNSSSRDITELFMKSEIEEATSALLHRLMAKAFSLVDEVLKKEPSKLKEGICKTFLSNQRPQYHPYSMPNQRGPGVSQSVASVWQQSVGGHQLVGQQHPLPLSGQLQHVNQQQPGHMFLPGGGMKPLQGQPGGLPSNPR